MELENIRSNRFRYWQVLLVLILLIPFLLSSNCSTYPEIEEIEIPFEVLRAFISIKEDETFEIVDKCEYDRSKIEIPFDSENLFAVKLKLDNDFEFGKIINCNDSVNIDFQKEIIIGGITSIQGSPVYVYKQTLELKNDTLYYEVGLNRGLNAIPFVGEYMIKVLSKEYAEYPVSFNYHFRYPK
ncbi:MAG TPA: hypothetical protein DCX27_03130 [Balneola sp.]|nr:hypothetical protein [Balneola sp.]